MNSTEDSLTSRHGRLLRAWRAFVQALKAVALAESIVVITILILVLPSIFSGIRQIDITVQVISAPSSMEFPLSQDFSDDSYGNLGSLKCIKRVAGLKEAKYALDCSFIADEVATGLNYLEEKGFVFSNSFSNMGVKPHWGSGPTYAWQAVSALLMWFIWLRLYSVNVRTDLRMALGFLRNRPLYVLFPFVASTVIISFLTHILNLQPSDIGRADYGAWSFVIITAVVIAPLFEEVVFRGFVYEVLTKRLSWMASSIIGAGSFVLVHLMPTEASITDYLGIFIMGFGLCWLKKASSSLSLCVIAHSLYNALSLLLLSFAR